MRLSAKHKWLGLLCLASLLFLLGLYTQKLGFFLGTVLLAVTIRKYGYNSLFQEFDEQQKAKRLRAEAMMKAVNEKRRKEKVNRGGRAHE